ncbi:hypothetical protein, partial [Salmonella enterica]|uniref:hypothetical protein n=1 Tax=Salmonella enterica TaxID=28901 RepID=UPI0038BAA807
RRVGNRKTPNPTGRGIYCTGNFEPPQRLVSVEATALMPFSPVRGAWRGLKGKIFTHGGGHDELSGNKKTAVGYRKAHFLSLTKTILRLVTGN